jgi:hypothetical protein
VQRGHAESDRDEDACGGPPTSDSVAYWGLRRAMAIRDPGQKYAYLVVELGDGKELFVRKDCRVKRFDPHWETEPVPEDYKPDLTIFASNVPAELWKILNTEEILQSLLAESRWNAKRFKRQRNNLIAALALVGWLVVVVLAFWLEARFR